MAACAVAMSLLELAGVSGADGDTPASHEVERVFIGGRLCSIWWDFCDVTMISAAYVSAKGSLRN